MAELVKTLGDVAVASISTIGDVAIASIKSIGDVDNTDGGGVTYLLEENFEATGYDATWGTIVGTPDPDYTGVVLQGSQSWRMNLSATNGNIIHTLAADHDTLEVYFRIHVVTLPGTARSFLTLLNSSDAVVLQCLLRTTGNWTARPTSGATGANSVTNMSLATMYHVWIRYERGTGANAIGTIGYSTDGTRPTSGNNFVSVTTGDASTAARKIRLGITNSETAEVIVDRVLAIDGGTVIGNSP